MTTTRAPAQGDLFTRRFPSPGSLEQARRRVYEARRDGIACPCCEQWCQVHRRRVNRTQARLLRALVEAYVDGGGGDVVHVSEIKVDGRDARAFGGELAKLAHFGLIEAAPNVTEERKGASGRWRPTSLGVAFADGRAEVPAWVELYNNVPVDHAVDTITIDDALGTPADARTTPEVPR